LIKSRAPHDGLRYWEIAPDGKVDGLEIPGCSDGTLPARPERLPGVAFVVCTNAIRLKVELKPGTVVSVTEAVLNRKMKVDRKKLANDAERRAWGEFRNTVVKDVRIQFLFTRGA
jgi:hypothetical protein